MLIWHVIVGCVVTVSAAIVGIDYGHQYTKSVLLAPGISFEVVLTDQGKRKDLSAISIRKRDGGIERVYGSNTGSLCTRFPHSCVLGLKSILGRTKDDIEIEEYVRANPGVKVISDNSRSGAIKFDLGLDNQSYNFAGEELLAMNLHELQTRVIKELDAESNTKSHADDVVITVPPFASQETRRAYIDALNLAGFPNILGLVEEGTAVALNYVSSRKLTTDDYNDVKQYHMIYDMGAGSTKATLFSFTPFSNKSIVLELESVGYDEKLGGESFTDSLYYILLENFYQYYKIDDGTRIPSKVSARLKETAEKAKIVLSVNTDFSVNLENLWDDQDFRTSLTRSLFEETSNDILERLVRPILNAITSLGPDFSISNINSVILSGGSTRVPLVQKHLSSLFGDERISKTVNADESCVQGATLRGLQLKTKLQKKNSISVIDKNFRNYEVQIPEVDGYVPVFLRGSEVSDDRKLELGGLKDSLTIDLFEDGRLIKSYSFDDLEKKTSQLSCEGNNKVISANFYLDHNKIFDVKDVEVSCAKDKVGLLDKLLKKDKKTEETELDDDSLIENDLNNSTNATDHGSGEKSKAKKSKVIKVQLPKPIYPRISPLSRVAKERLSSKLHALNKEDETRLKVDHAKNTLEANCYELRALLNDHEDLIRKEVSSDDFDLFQAQLSDVMEWLEFDSTHSLLSDIEKRIDEVKQRKILIDSVVKMSNTDLSKPALEKLYDDGSKIAMKIQSFMLDSGSQISEIRKKYEQEGFHFDKENDRLKIKMMNANEKISSLDKALVAYKSDLRDLGSIINKSDGEFKKLSKSKLYKLYQDVTARIVDMLADLLIVEGSHSERMRTLNEKFDKLLDRKKKKLLREKQKIESQSSKEEQEKVSATDTIESFETSNENKEKETNDETTTGTYETGDEMQHDEL